MVFISAPGPSTTGRDRVSIHLVVLQFGLHPVLLCSFDHHYEFSSPFLLSLGLSSSDFRLSCVPFYTYMVNVCTLTLSACLDILAHHSMSRSFILTVSAVSPGDLSADFDSI